MTTRTGFEATVQASRLNDMELLEIIGAVDDGETQKLPQLCKMLLGEEQKKALYDHCRTEAGNVPIDAVLLEMQDIFKALSEDAKTKK